jgi:hypothetical protein
MHSRDLSKHTTFELEKALTVGVKFELEILRLKAISLFGKLRSSKYDPTSIERRMEGNDWHKIHQERLHKLLVVILSYYQKIHSLSDLREIMTDLISQDEIKIPESFLGWTNDYLHTHTKGFYEPDHSVIVNLWNDCR